MAKIAKKSEDITPYGGIFLLWANLSVLPSRGQTVRFPRLSRFPLALLRAPALLRFGRDRFAGPGSARCGRVAHPVRRKAQSPGFARAFSAVPGRC